MGGESSATAGRRYRRSRRLRGRRGVVAVIGTLLALLVFFALFGIFLTQYLPLWMTDNESQFSAAAAASFAQFKSAVDTQYALGGPQTYGVPFTLSSDSVPLLAQPTQGTLTFLPQSCSGGFYTATTSGHNATNLGQPLSPTACTFLNVTIQPGPGGSSYSTQAIPSGVLQFALPNRYYTPETFYFEDDAVIQSQSSGYQIMAIPPPLNITHVGGNTTVTTSVLQLYGNSSAIIGQGSEDVYSHLRYSQFLGSNGGSPTSPVTTFSFEVGTQYPCAWSNFLYNLVKNQSGLASLSPVPFNLHPFKMTGYSGLPYTGSCFNSASATTVLAFTVTTVSYVEMYLAGVQLTLGVGGT
jgi:hypothetical protein